MKKYLLLSTAAIIALAAGVGLYFTYFRASSAIDGSTQDDSINYSPPTEEEQQAGDTQKQQIEDQSDNDRAPATDDGQQKSVNVAITQPYVTDDNVEVGGFTSDIIEGDGRCTATFSKDSATISKSGPAFMDATTTQCEPIVVSRNQFSSTGNWLVVLSYESTDYQGSSSEVSFEL